MENTLEECGDASSVDGLISGVLDEAELETMQRIENGVWRAVLGAPGYAPVVTLRAKVGTSNMLIRDLKTKICDENT